MRSADTLLSASDRNYAFK